MARRGGRTWALGWLIILAIAGTGACESDFALRRKASLALVDESVTGEGPATVQSTGRTGTRDGETIFFDARQWGYTCPEEGESVHPAIGDACYWRHLRPMTLDEIRRAERIKVRDELHRMGWVFVPSCGLVTPASRVFPGRAEGAAPRACWPFWVTRLSRLCPSCAKNKSPGTGALDVRGCLACGALRFCRRRGAAFYAVDGLIDDHAALERSVPIPDCD